MHVKKIYIAGWDVFRKDSVEVGKRYVKLCAEYGFEGLYPLDNKVDFDQSKQKIAQDIFKANVAMIQKADIVIANLNPFRGKEPDSGTVWECGYAYALGKKVYGYMKDVRNYIERFDISEKTDENGITYDTQGLVIEDFEYPLNLMLSCSLNALVEGEFEDVLKAIRA